jgi:hypothetical protein
MNDEARSTNTNGLSHQASRFGIGTSFDIQNSGFVIFRRANTPITFSIS